MFEARARFQAGRRSLNWQEASIPLQRKGQYPFPKNHSPIGLYLEASCFVLSLLRTHVLSTPSLTSRPSRSSIPSWSLLSSTSSPFSTPA